MMIDQQLHGDARMLPLPSPPTAKLAEVVAAAVNIIDENAVVQFTLSDVLRFLERWLSTSGRGSPNWFNEKP